MQRTRPDRLLPAIEHLEKALQSDPAASKPPALGRLQQALKHLDAAFVRHEALAREADGLFAALNKSTQSTRPTLDRRVKHLREDWDRLHGLVADLRCRVQMLNEPVHGWHRFWQALAATGRFREACFIREDGKHLAEALRRHHYDEDRLLLDALNTDIGAGD